MAFLHCHNCEWSQDDFWHKDYNPATTVATWMEQLLETPDLDEKFATGETTDEIGNLTMREVIAQEFEQAAKRIREMRFRNMDEATAAGMKCPACGSDLDCD